MVLIAVAASIAACSGTAKPKPAEAPAPAAKKAAAAAPPWHQYKQMLSLLELQSRDASAPRSVGTNRAVLGYAKVVQRSQAFFGGRTQPRTILQLVDGTQIEPLSLQVFGALKLDDAEDLAEAPLVLCTSLTVQTRPRMVVTAGAVHVLKLSAEEAAGDQRAEATTKWWAELPPHRRAQAFDPPKKKRKRVRRAVPTGDDALSLDSGDESGSKRPRPGTLDGFLHAAQAIFGDDSEEDTAEQDEAENAQPSAEQAQPEPRAAEQVRPEEKDLKDPAVSPMFSPPASSVKPPERSPTSS